MGVLAIDHAHAVRPGELEQDPDRGNGRLGVRDEQAAALAHEVVLHVDDDERGASGVDADILLDRIHGKLDRPVHAASGPERSASIAVTRPTRRTKRGSVPAASPNRDSYELAPSKILSPTVIVPEPLPTLPCHCALPSFAVMVVTVDAVNVMSVSPR